MSKVATANTETPARASGPVSACSTPTSWKAIGPSTSSALQPRSARTSAGTRAVGAHDAQLPPRRVMETSPGPSAHGGDRDRPRQAGHGEPPGQEQQPQPRGARRLAQRNRPVVHSPTSATRKYAGSTAAPM